MKAQLIEKLDRDRYSALKWMAISIPVFYCPLIMTSFQLPKVIRGTVATLYLIGGFMFFFSILKLVKVVRKINSDPELKQALNNEMHMRNSLKSFQWAFFSILILAPALVIVSSIWEISASIAMQIVIFACTMAVLTAFLYYDRDLK